MMPSLDNQQPSVESPGDVIKSHFFSPKVHCCMHNNCCGALARDSDSRLREPEFEACVAR